jgi:hypothetical protein
MEIVTVPDKSLSGSLSLRLSEWLDRHGVFLPKPESHGRARDHPVMEIVPQDNKALSGSQRLSLLIKLSLSHTHTHTHLFSSYVNVKRDPGPGRDRTVTTS